MQKIRFYGKHNLNSTIATENDPKIPFLWARNHLGCILQSSYAIHSESSNLFEEYFRPPFLKTEFWSQIGHRTNAHGFPQATESLLLDLGTSSASTRCNRLFPEPKQSISNSQQSGSISTFHSNFISKRREHDTILPRWYQRWIWPGMLMQVFEKMRRIWSHASPNCINFELISSQSLS